MELKISSTHSYRGPVVPCDFGAFVRDHRTGGREIFMLLGDLSLRVYPYNPEQIKNFGEKLIEITQQCNLSDGEEWNKNDI